MSISTRIEQIEQHLTDDYSVLEVTGADLTNIDKNIVNLKPTWQERLLYFMDNGTEEVWNNWNKATGEGTSISLNNTLEAKMKIELKGNTYQEGTPTPNTPQEVQIVTGNNTIKVEGKNLWGDIPIFTRTNAGITATQNEDGTITLSGTSSGSTGSITFAQAVENGIYKKLEAGTYTISCDMATNNIWIQAYKTSDSSSTLAVARSSTGASFTLTEEANVFIRIWINTSGIVTDGTYKIQLEKGSKTSYEPYKSQSYEINLGKNLFDKNNYTEIIGTINSTNFFRGGGANYCIAIPCQPDTTYTVQKRNDGSTNRFALASSETMPSGVSDVDTPILNNLRDDTASVLTITTGATANYLIVQYYRNAETILTKQQLLDSIQIEEGSQATSYSAYKTPIELCKIGDYQDSIRKGTGKNLFDKDNANSINAYINTNNNTFALSSTVKTYYISCNGNTTYTIQKVLGKQFRVGTSSDIPVVNGTLLQAWQNNDATQYTITTNSNAKYLCINIRNSSTDTLTEQEILDSVMINEGTTALPYEPYGYKYKWYIYKAIGKVVLDGSENWGYSTSNAVFYVSVWSDRLTNSNDMLSNYFNVVPTSTSYANMVNGSFRRDTGTQARTVFKATSYASVNDFKTWLGTHNTIVYYVLATTTYEEITDSELLSQLNALEGSRSYQGQTNINQENSNLASILNATALQEM